MIWALATRSIAAVIITRRKQTFYNLTVYSSVVCCMYRRVYHYELCILPSPYLYVFVDFTRNRYGLFPNTAVKDWRLYSELCGVNVRYWATVCYWATGQVQTDCHDRPAPQRRICLSASLVSHVGIRGIFARYLFPLRCFRRIEKSGCQLRHVCLCPSIWPQACNKSATTGQIFMKFGIRVFFEKCPENFQFNNNNNNNNNN